MRHRILLTVLACLALASPGAAAQAQGKPPYPEVTDISHASPAAATAFRPLSDGACPMVKA